MADYFYSMTYLVASVAFNRHPYPDCEAALTTLLHLQTEENQ